MDDFKQLESLSYSGRGLTLGVTPKGSYFLGYHLTGRSEPSKERKLITGNRAMVTRAETTNPYALRKGNPTLLIYPAAGQYSSILFGSNGIQTELIYRELINNMHILKFDHDKYTAEKINMQIQITLIQIMQSAFGKPDFRYDPEKDTWIDITTFEPDYPIHTSRINATILENAGVFYRIKHGRVPEENPRATEMISKKIEPGQAWTMTTYKGGNENPPLPSTGEPLEARIESEHPKEISQSIFSAISHGLSAGENYAVAASVIMISNISGKIETANINRPSED
jgi:hypothetical protein